MATYLPARHIPFLPPDTHRTGPALGPPLPAVCPAADPIAELRLPMTSARTTPNTWVKLVTRVDVHAASGFGFDGKVYPPGAHIPLDDLPDRALALECAGGIGPGWGHKRRDLLYILWKYDRARREWRDVAQARSINAEWAMALRPIAARELSDPEERALAIDADGVAERVMHLLDAELEDADLCATESVLAVLHDRLAARVAKLYRRC